MKKYIRSSDDADFGYGYDSNGEPIDESTVDELYRVANEEVLPTTELAEFGICDIDDDEFEYYATGTAWGANLNYIIRFALNPVAFADRAREFSNGKDISAIFIDLRNPNNEVETTFDISVNGSNFDVELVEVNITENGSDASDTIYDSFDKLFSKRKIENFVARIAEDAVNKIHATLSNI